MPMARTEGRAMEAPTKRKRAAPGGTARQIAESGWPQAIHHRSQMRLLSRSNTLPTTSG